MGVISAYLLCLAYILGLFLTGIPDAFGGCFTGAIAMLSLGIGAAFFMPRIWRTGPRSRLWIATGLVGLIGILYFTIRTPSPPPNDISYLVAPSGSSQMNHFEIYGQIDSSPRLTRSDRTQFTLRATAAVWKPKLISSAPLQFPLQSVSGKLYVTVPKEHGDGLYPGQSVIVTGNLYKPKSVSNPGEFDFQAYLAERGIFAGLSGQISGSDTGMPPFPRRALIQRYSWQLQQRIFRAQTQPLGTTYGSLAAAMAIGTAGIDMPFDLRDYFAQAGLAHALAASGFQVSLLVSIIVAATQRLPKSVRLWSGIGIIVSYISLTGAQPSVLRAGIMGIAVLLALITERKVKPLGSLLIAGTILLAANPQWIWDLGFQFSFLATLGLLVTVPTLTQWLDWIPPMLASAVAVPLAAYIWTLPLQLSTFGIVSPYSIVINVLATPLILVVSLGSMTSALLALIYPALGSISAYVLLYPIRGLVSLAQFGSTLPGSAYAIGTIASWTVICIYGLYGLVWWQRHWRRGWWLAGLTTASLILVPVWLTQTFVKVTVLAITDAPIMVIQDRGQTALINVGSEETVNFAIAPFLQKHGINRLDWAIATHPFSSSNPDTSSNPNTGWSHISQLLPGEVSQLHLRDLIQMRDVAIEAFNIAPAVIKLYMGTHDWLMIDCGPLRCQQPLESLPLQPAQVLWWTGEPLSEVVLNIINPQVAIASSHTLDINTRDLLASRHVKTYITGQDGAIQWSERQGFSTQLTPEESSLSLF